MKKLAIVFALLAMAGCDTWETTSLPREARASEVPASVNPATIRIVEGPMPAGSYRKLADLRVTVNKTTAFHPNPTREQVIDKLRTDAAKLGADAVIDVAVSEVQISAFSWGTRTGTGTAVSLAR
ncbi:MAG: heavy metal-binding domain-containing protein [Pseudooceanicola sp.]|nr:heavy metal-binding domain-containing protein [Pseudooceanicola sp.]